MSLFKGLSFRLRIREIRLEKRFPQSYVAKELGFASSSGLQHIENGSHRLDIVNAWKLSQIYECPMEELLEVTESETT
ncbi:helix-turn-helix domain-containing protein [Brevibacillus migulae]|uniref:helix-turn-helix domain-containing protein n=1 Tax=Brevibacillus migulae TaxID=1644114 RepID=UPI00106E69FD|nr:helix-turn-helix transcriptional regulator [Brevibacillus migulae]